MPVASPDLCSLSLSPAVPAFRSTQHRGESPQPPTLVDVAGKHLYFIGVGGSGMSGLAQMLAKRGAIVAGSDKETSAVTAALEAMDIAVSLDQQFGTLPAACDIVIASAAIKHDHPQILTAQSRGVPLMSYAQALGQTMRGSTGLAVAGTHGKSTTTAMLGCALVDARLDPSVIVGATCPQLSDGSLAPRTAPVGFRCGSSRVPAGLLSGAPGLLVAEACEYNRSFHHFYPTLACINNIEADHLDVYGTLDQVVASFREFAGLLPIAEEGGKLLIGHDGAHRREVTSGLKCEVHSIGFHPGADWCVAYDARTREVLVTHEGLVAGSWINTLAGAHNASNAANAFVLGLWAGADPTLLAASLSKFAGADRRMQFMGQRMLPASQGGGKVRVFDDYGHHPTEIEVTLRAFRESEAPHHRDGRLIVVFQPHQHSRTRHLLEEFAASFENADLVLVPHIYFVRDSEEERQRVAAGDLVDRLRAKGINAMHLYPFEAITQHLLVAARDGDVVVVMGAGDVWRIGKDYLAA